MRVFLTGATGFIGSHIIPELLAAGHDVVGLTRSGEGARKLEQVGVTPRRGVLEDPTTLASGAAAADAVIHCAFDHDFSSAEAFEAAIAKDVAAIGVMGEALAGSDRPFIVTSGVGFGCRGPGSVATEDYTDWENPNPRIGSERAARDAADKGASVAIVRLPQVHDNQRQGLVTPYVAASRANCTAAYVGDGSNRWSAAHVSDVARLYLMALERHEKGAIYNAVGEEGVAFRDIAGAVATGLGVRAKALEQDAVGPFFAAVNAGFLTLFIGMDISASSKLTQERLGWGPTGPTLVDDLQSMDYQPYAMAVA